ncbi:MAG: sulfotransferase family 2 domain-containing protein [Planctomycetes bacterium]|nr:sulfotransferase family 2 domain-containing protein [Planctomycetota bacterium]
MILTRHFVFLHVPKTGGNFVRAVLEEHAPADWQVARREDHATFADIPDSHRGLPKLAFVRNPFAWYVSWFHFQQKTRDAFFLEISDGGRLDFAASMRNVFRDGGALQHGEGPFLQTLWHMLGRGLEGCRVGKMETMREDLLRLIAEQCPVSPDMAAAIASLPAQNTSRHRHYARYYDDELRALVLQKDRAIFDHFGYRWQDAPD